MLASTLLYLFSFAVTIRAQTQSSSGIDAIKQGFAMPPAAARPGVYWYFMDGNRNKAAMTADMESMKAAGISSLIYLEVNVGIPRGPVDFLSDEWKNLFRHAVKEGERLGIEIILGTGPGWAGSGGPWIQPASSMQHMVASTVYINDTARAAWKKTRAGEPAILLPVPSPRKPYFGMGALTPELHKEWEAYYRDIAVLAFPTPAIKQSIAGTDEKALYYRAPYTSAKGVQPWITAPAVYPVLPAAVVSPEHVIDISSKMDKNGLLHWNPPPGNWTIMRFGARNNGAVTRPAPVPGLGFEVDKMDTVALNAHLEKYVGELLAKTGEPDTTLAGGFKRLHIDSWEMGAQNWTPHFREAFIKRRGYDPLPYYPAYTGCVIGNEAISERFLWDLRQTCQELVLEYHAGQVKKYSHRHGLKLSIEPYDMNPTADLELGAVADIPMCEFWSKGYGFNASFSCIEAVSVAHVNGIPLVPAEAFTADDREGWRQYPGSMKNQGDWAFAAGINKLMYHTFEHQPLDARLRPGMTMGPYGVHWDRGQTWWPMVDGYHQYITRCQYLLQQGRTIADILYLTPEGAPHVFRAPASAFSGDAVLPDRKGYNFDGCAPGQLYKATVQNGHIVFPGGASYRLLVLPASKTMTPALLHKISSLVQDGATVIGGPPEKSPGLSGYPYCDDSVHTMATALWGSLQEPARQSVHAYGKGHVIYGGAIAFALLQKDSALYPAYAVTEKILQAIGLVPDFVSDSSLRYTHRTGAGWDIYFVANRTGSLVHTTAGFRSKGVPELWDPQTGKSRLLPEFTVKGTQTFLPLVLQPYQSCFIVFKQDGRVNSTNKYAVNFPVQKELMKLSAPWQVSFDTAWGGPAVARFDTLSDWSKSNDKRLQYYSGRAVYRTRFNLPAATIHSGEKLYLDLGDVKDMARVHLNGADLGVVWTAPLQVEITGHVQPANNQLEIEVANRWANRMIGDEQLPDDGVQNGQWPEWLVKGEPRPGKRYSFASFHPYTKDAPLLPSGLLGPVTIKSEKTMK